MMQPYNNLDHSAISSLPGSPISPGSETQLASSLMKRMHAYRDRHNKRRRIERVLRWVFGRGYRHGVTRVVVLTRHSAIKMPRIDSGLTLFLLGWLSNRRERQKWEHARDWKCTKDDYNQDPCLHLAPVLCTYLWGLVLVMKRCDEITQQEGKAFIMAEVAPSGHTPGIFDWHYWCTDQHAANFGRLEGRVVCLDYSD